MSISVKASSVVPGMADAMSFLGSFLFVIAILVALLLGLRWLQRRQPATQGARLRLAESIYIGPRHRVILVEVDDQSFLVGVSPQQFTLIGQTRSVVDTQSAGLQ